MTVFEILENVDFDLSYNHVLDFETPEMQKQYFDEKVRETITNCSVVRDNQEVKIEKNYNEITSNYCRYINTINGVTKIMYAFIIKKEYVNREITRLYLEVDVWQTFMFDYELKKSFIDRQHKDRFEKIGSSLKPIFDRIPENLDAGSDYDVIKREKINDKFDKNINWFCLLVKKPLNAGSFSSSDPATFKNMSVQLHLNTLATQFYCYILPDKQIKTYDATGKVQAINEYDWTITSFLYSNETLSIKALPYCPVKYNIDNLGNYVFNGGYDGSVATRSARNCIVPLNNEEFKLPPDLTQSVANIGGWALQIGDLNELSENLAIKNYDLNYFLPTVEDINPEKPANINNETKLHTFPYEYLTVTNYQSAPLQLKIENLPDKIEIDFRQNLDVVSKSKIWVKNYNNDNGKENSAVNQTMEEITLWNDAFATYLSQNRASATTGFALNVATGVGMLGLGIATGGVGLVAGVAGAVGIGSQIANELINRENLKQTPPNIQQLGNNLSFDILDDNLKYFVSQYKIKPQFNELLYYYLMFYGYKSSNFETPNTKSRFYYNYIKTIGVNIKSNLSSDYVEKIKAIYDNGVTIWHYRNKSTFKGLYNYDYENAEMKLLI